MPRIPALTSARLTDLNAGSLLPIYINEQGDPYKMSLTTLIQYFQQNFTRPDLTETIYTPSDGFNIVLPVDALSRWIQLNPTSSIATGTIVLPSIANLSDGQEYLITTTLQVTSFTLNGSDATAVYGVPAVLAAEDTLTIRYSAQQKSWFRVG